MMAFTGAVDAIVTANLLSSEPLYTYRTIGLDTHKVHSDLGINISVSEAITTLNVDAFDMLFICGGFRTQLIPQPTLFKKLREANRYGLTLGGLWNGSLLLAWAGLLNGYKCSLHPDNADVLEETCPQVQLSETPFVIDRDRVSCAGASSALEMMLAIITSHHDHDISRGIEEILGYERVHEQDIRPMRASSSDPSLPQSLRVILGLMDSNIEEPLALDEIARFVNLSRRQVERLFQRYMDCTPSKFYLELRITRARRLLLQSNHSITGIAMACGFVSTSHFSHCYRDYFGISPRQSRHTPAYKR